MSWLLLFTCLVYFVETWNSGLEMMRLFPVFPSERHLDHWLSQGQMNMDSFNLTRDADHCFLPFPHSFWSSFSPFSCPNLSNTKPSEQILTFSLKENNLLLRRVRKNVQTDILTENTNKTMLFWEQRRASFSPQDGKHFGKKKENCS